MYDRPRRARAVFVLLLLLAAILVTVDFRQGPGGPVDALQRGATAVFGPVQRGVSAVVRPVGGFFGSLGELGSLRGENERLGEENQRLRSQARAAEGLEEENDGLRATLAMAERCGCPTVGAQVVAHAGSNFQWSVTIDVGTSDGVAEGMAVIDGDGLVGRVIQVTSDYAVVLLITDPSSGIAGRAAGDRSTGLLRGQGEDRLELELLQPDAEIAEGETVVTQGYADSVFPAGIPVGVVAEIAPAEDLVRRAAVTPLARLGALDTVAVVVDEASSADGGQNADTQASEGGR